MADTVGNPTIDNDIRNVFLNKHRGGQYFSNQKLFNEYNKPTASNWSGVDPESKVITDQKTIGELQKKYEKYAEELVPETVLSSRLRLFVPDNKSFVTEPKQSRIRKIPNELVDSGNKGYIIFVVRDTLSSTPNHRDAFKVTQFLNRMPSTLLSSMVPYVDVEFEFRNPRESIDKDFAKNSPLADLFKREE